VFRSNFLTAKKNSSFAATRLTREGVQFVFMLLFVVFAAILQSINMLVLMSGALLAILFIQWRLMSRTLSDIQMQRVLPSTIQARRPFVVQLSLRNPRRRLGSWLMLIHDQVVPKETPLGKGVPGQSITLFLDRLLPKQVQSLGYECMVPIRGRYQFSAPEISTRFPFSLMRRVRSLPISQSILAHPTQGVLDPNWRKFLKLPRLGRIHRQSSSAGGDGEFYGLRDYRHGDPVRHVHWRTSAKRDKLVIRQFEREESQAIAILLDPWRSTKQLQNGNASLEIAVELVASIIVRVTKTERSVATLAVAEEQQPFIARIQTLNQTGAALDRLSTVTLPKVDGLMEAMRQTLRYTGGREPIVVVSARSRSEFSSTRTAANHSTQTSSDSDAWTREQSIENRVIWIDVSSDRLDHFFVRG